MISEELESNLHNAFDQARQRRHEFITVEHLLLALLDNASAAAVLRSCDANVDALRESLATFVAANTPTDDERDVVETQPTLGFQRVIQRAIALVPGDNEEKAAVTGTDVLVALFDEQDTHAVLALRECGVTRAGVMHAIAGRA